MPAVVSTLDSGSPNNYISAQTAAQLASWKMLLTGQQNPIRLYSTQHGGGGSGRASSGKCSAQLKAKGIIIILLL